MSINNIGMNGDIGGIFGIEPKLCSKLLSLSYCGDNLGIYADSIVRRVGNIELEFIYPSICNTSICSDICLPSSVYWDVRLSVRNLGIDRLRLDIHNVDLSYGNSKYVMRFYCNDCISAINCDVLGKRGVIGKCDLVDKCVNYIGVNGFISVHVGSYELRGCSISLYVFDIDSIGGRLLELKYYVSNYISV